MSEEKKSWWAQPKFIIAAVILALGSGLAVWLRRKNAGK